ncbi:MAG TPA: shikimate dehydrogenase [Candidatus Binatia bacterium]|nr:shikimate dehydrogenase [Candidatus Binatia bacterium]
MTTAEDLAVLQTCVGNHLDTASTRGKRIAGVIGAAPSRYSKSPALWDAAFRFAAIQAVYLPFDVEGSQLREFAAALRNCESVMGINVTVPHKLAIMEQLDELDASAARIQAVNTVVRTQEGRLVGYNTDGAGFIASILQPHPEQNESFLIGLSGAVVLLLGAGGSARAVGFHVSDLLDGGRLTICNRTREASATLAAEISTGGIEALAVPEAEVARWAPKAALIINCTTKGQGSSSLEPYSALAPAPLSASGGQGDEEAIALNNQESLRLAAMVPKEARFYDLIYHPGETVFLRHARMTGHKTMNGKAMIICQAALAFANHVCAEELRARGLDRPDTWKRVVEIMYDAW